MQKNWRRANPEDRCALGTLYAEGFSLHSPYQFYDDFPLWDPELSVPNRLQILSFSEGNSSLALTSTASVAVRELAETRRKVGIVGGVVVREEYRGEGLAREVLQTLLEESEKELGIEEWVLWTGNPALYEHFGFKPAGIQHRAIGVKDWVLKEIDILREASKYKASENLKVSHGFTSDLFRKIQARSFGLRLESSHFKLYEQMRNVDWWRIENDLHEIKAYVGIGRGIDLPNIIHEWSGELDYLVPLLREVLKVHPNPEWIFTDRLLEEDHYLSFLDIQSTDPLCFWRGVGKQLSDKEKTNLWFWGGDSS